MDAMGAYTEHVCIPDTFVSGLAEVEDLGEGNYRFTFFARRKPMGYHGAVECEIVARLILPASAVQAAMRMTEGVMGRCGRH
jgi:hypothetical protein